MTVPDERATAFQKRRGSAKVFGLSGLALVMAILLFTTWRGLDFGEHYDEFHVIASVQRSSQTGVLLPINYVYPALTYDLSLLSLVVPIAEYLRTVGLPDSPREGVVAWGRQLRSHLYSYCASPHFYIVNRALVAVVSSAVLIWVYLLVIVWRKNPFEALLASAIVGLSWEVAYHIRSVTPGGLMMEFGALTMLLMMVQEIKSPVSQGPIYLAAFLAGLTTGAKYTAAFLIVPVLVVALTSPHRIGSLRASIKPVAGLVGLFLAGYLLSTPGTLVDPARFYAGIALARDTYMSHNNVHNVGIGFDHLGRMLSYFFGAVASPFRVPSYFLASFGLIGLVSIMRQEPRHALVFLLFPVLLILLLALHPVMFVRNLLILIPVWAILCARGVFFALDRFRGNRYLAVGLGIAVTVSLALNGFWLVYAGESIHKRSLANDLQEFVAYAQEHSGDVGTSEPLAEELKKAGLTIPAGRDGKEAKEPAFLAFRRLEVDWNRPDLKWRYNITARFGSYDANLKYYPDNNGHDHILVMPRADALGLRIVEHLVR